MVERRSIDAFYGMSSPWAYLGAPRLRDIALRHDLVLRLRPIRIIQENGGIPLRTRPKARQRYHAVELARWSRILGMPLNPAPRYYPCRTIELAAQSVITVQNAGLDPFPFSFAIQQALWANDRDIADLATLRELAKETIGEEGATLLTDPAPRRSRDEWQANLTEAETLGIFGTPTYVFQGELFWGQDRLNLLERAIIASLIEGERG